MYLIEVLRNHIQNCRASQNHDVSWLKSEMKRKLTLTKNIALQMSYNIVMTSILKKLTLKPWFSIMFALSKYLLISLIHQLAFFKILNDGNLYMSDVQFSNLTSSIFCKCIHTWHMNRTSDIKTIYTLSTFLSPAVERPSSFSFFLMSLSDIRLYTNLAMGFLLGVCLKAVNEQSINTDGCLLQTNWRMQQPKTWVSQTIFHCIVVGKKQPIENKSL